MFNVLPLNQIRDEDSPLYGQSIINLARLIRLSFPVPHGLVITPPDAELKKAIKRFQTTNPEIFEQNFKIIKDEFLNIPVPVLLTEHLRYQSIDADKLWQGLLTNWLEEMRSVLWRLGYEIALTQPLSAQPVIFTGPIATFGQAYHDKELDKVLITIDKGGLSVDQETEIEELVRRANRKLFLPQVYDWIVESPGKDLKIVKLSPFTDNLEKVSSDYKSTNKIKLKDLPKVKTAYKVWADLSGTLTVNPNLDGIFISGDQIPNFDELVFKLVETGKSFKHLPLIFKLSPNPKLTSLQAEAYAFCKHKQDLANLELVIPAVRSVKELSEVKQLLSAKNINRRGNKFWLEIATPENILNMSDYLESGLDGIILKLDQLAVQIGCQIGDFRPVIKMVQQVIPILHTHKLPFLTTGILSWNSDLLQFFIDQGGSGVIADLPNSYFLPEYINFLETRTFKKRVNSDSKE